MITNQCSKKVLITPLSQRLRASVMTLSRFRQLMLMQVCGDVFSFFFKRLDKFLVSEHLGDYEVEKSCLSP